ncbi:MAG TPA: TetR/AcrR family transcriptional regulator [Isosphaeraceae bacterium]|nr:TetR/AcrR family transcriptional regulator [Isosphaeraceae bacterium]
MAEPTATGSRLERRKARTRAALISATQSFIAAGKLSVPILEITQAADVGLGSFYNHFESKEDLFAAAVEDVLELLGGLLDELTADIDDPAVIFAQSFRLFGRFHRRSPQMSKVFLNNGLAMAGSTRGLAPRALRDIQAGIRAQRFTVRDPELAATIIVGASLCLGQFIHDHPERDDAQATDEIAEDLLRLLGIPARQAQRIIALPLPDLDTLRGRDGQAAPPDPAPSHSGGQLAGATRPAVSPTA